MALFVVILSAFSAVLLGVFLLLHLAGQSAAAQGAIVLAALGASWVMTRVVNRKPLGSIGLFFHPRMLYETVMGLLLGFVMMAAIFLAEFALGYLSVVQRQPGISEALGGLGSLAVEFTLAGAAEELIFRGYLFQTCLQGIGFLPATLVFSGLFALAHGFNPGITWLAAFNIFLAGIWLSVAYMKTRSLWLPIALHVGWNFSQSAIFSFPTSGIDFSGRTLFILVQGGPLWLTGGTFGPEAGAMGTVAILLCTWHILKSPRYAAPEGIITLDSLEDLLPAGAGGDGSGGGQG
jgi:membrane protease YdiL (CAAX protease family)